MTNEFAEAQPMYAEHGIATFPVRFVGKDKKPAIKGYGKVGLEGSKQLTLRFAQAEALGFMCGLRANVAVGDVDTTSENDLADFLDRHGSTPIIAKTANGKHHAWYRFNGEGRHVRPWEGRPFDILGGGFVVVPPSRAPTGGQYKFIQGSLDDLDRLSSMRNLDARLYAGAKRKRDIANPLRDMREGDGRNKKLFQTIGPVAREIHAVRGDKDALLSVALSHNAECEEPMAVQEVQRVVDNVWRLTVQHRNWIGGGGRAVERQQELAKFSREPETLFLLEYLRVNEGASARFWIANGLAKNFGWTLRQLTSARKNLIGRGYIKQVSGAWTGHPAVYCWNSSVDTDLLNGGPA